MYDKRIKIFVILIVALLLVCVLRLAQMQLLSGSFYSEEIAKLKLQKSRSLQLKTIRGKILDRRGRILASDEPRFRLCISYSLGSLLDERVRPTEGAQDLKDKLEDLQQIIEKCAQFKGAEPSEIRKQIRQLNDFIWNRRVFQAWRTSFPNSEALQNYNDVTSIPLSEAISDFERGEPSGIRRLELVNKVDIAEMHRSWPLLELETDDDIFTAQLEFIDISHVEILPRAHRVYPYGSVAAQTIGWVGLPQKDDKELFANDVLSSYLDDEVCGREDGVEYVCETILRGRRGEVIYDIDRKMISRTPTHFGKDVSLTLDIELQQRIEKYLADCRLNPNCRAPIAVVVIEVATGDILALVSTPVFDLNRARYDYPDFARDPNEPLRNRAVNKQYPPGSVVKPLILVAGLESGKITQDEIISCPAQKAPKDWPSCWLYNRYGSGHDYRWENHARNAIKGSCNIYFSRLADRVEPLVLQQWLFKFGYGREIALARQGAGKSEHSRDFRQAAGIISTRTPPRNAVFGFEKFPIERWERRFLGIGQGNLRVTPLQVANAMAAIARAGVYKPPRLFGGEPNDSEYDLAEIDVSAGTLALIRDGMSAVVNEPGGTAYKEFAPSGLADQGVNVYGKTGSTENPDHAWFAGFADDDAGGSISLAVVVEGGEHGSQDAAPIARDVIQFCIEAAYIGQSHPTIQ
jgi:penicillin-binding protein 2